MGTVTLLWKEFESSPLFSAALQHAAGGVRSCKPSHACVVHSRHQQCLQEYKLRLPSCCKLWGNRGAQLLCSALSSRGLLSRARLRQHKHSWAGPHGSGNTQYVEPYIMPQCLPRRAWPSKLKTCTSAHQAPVPTFSKPSLDACSSALALLHDVRSFC